MVITGRSSGRDFGLFWVKRMYAVRRDHVFRVCKALMGFAGRVYNGFYARCCNDKYVQLVLEI